MQQALPKKMEDTFRHKGLRKKLVEFLKQEKGITDNQVLAAIGSVPRHYFLDSGFLEKAYQDIALQIGEGQTISRPHTVATQTSLLSLKKGEKVLEVGTGCGYQTAVLVEMGVKVFTIEVIKALFDRTSHLLPKLGYKPKFFYGDGYKGLPAFAPFDKIIVTAGAPFVPKDLTEQLKPGGILVIPVGAADVFTMHCIVKQADGSIETTLHGEFKFVPLVEKNDWGKGK